ncbi:hypothetical protein T11_10788 [Trichinella zimbabwensis]|uniref:Uncharacterized protein n=1 Tax=Trichinella zimbabwensis TaxID=268475 RepID=A0A0V1HF14_9BILA|nr:hypothetical protein T11_10788 [Trichinella zimbabwensis]
MYPLSYVYNEEPNHYEGKPPLDVSAVRGGSSVEVDTVGLEAIHPLSSSSPASSSLSLLLQRQKFFLPILRSEYMLFKV